MTRVSRERVRAAAWPIGFTMLAVLVFVFYKWIMPDLSTAAQADVNRWLPLVKLNECMIWVIMALGLNVVVGYAGLLDLGYVAFWAIGGYVAGWIMSSFAQDPTFPFVGPANFHFLSPTNVGKQPGIHISFWIVLVIAALVCAGAGVLIGAPTLRLRSDYLALVTLGFGEIIPEFVRNGGNIAGHNVTNGDKGINPVDAIGTGPFAGLKGVNPTIGRFDFAYKFVVFALLVAVCVFISLRLRHGRLGRAWLAIREDELAASMMGIPLMRTKLSAYAVGAFFGGLGGVAYAAHTSVVNSSTFSFSLSITILLMVVMGGMGNVWGVMIGALVLSWINNTGLEQGGQTFNDTFNTNIRFTSYNYLIFGVILVLMMLFRREGILPESRTRMILREPSRTEMEAVGADIELAEAEIEVVEETDEFVQAGSTESSDGKAP